MEHLVKNGVMNPEKLFEQSCTDFHAEGLAGGTIDSQEYWVDFVQAIEVGLSSNSTGDNEKTDKHFPLKQMEQLFRGHKDHGKLLGALIDLKMTFHFSANDFSYACGVYNEQLHQRVLSGRTSTEIFASKILFLRYLNSFVLRCRSFWDKAMGVLVLVYNPLQYEKFVKAKSRRSQFKKAMKNYLTDESIASIDKLINMLDTQFRTAEAHQTGTLRTWIFKHWDVNPMNTPMGYLLTIHNMTLEFAEQISKLLIVQGNSSKANNIQPAIKIA